MATAAEAAAEATKTATAGDGEQTTPPNVNLSHHPLLLHKATLLRDRETSARDFRKLLSEITIYLGYEATSALNVRPHTVETPMGTHTAGSKLSDRVAIVPILRAGLGMVDSMLDLMPNAGVFHIGMYRSKNALLPVQYYNRLPRDHSVDVAYVLDPMVATASTLRAVLTILKSWCNPRIVVLSAIASRPGLAVLHEHHPDVTVYTAQVDDTLDESGMLVPGLGDVGNRMFDTDPAHMADPEPMVMGSPRKRGRAAANGAGRKAGADGDDADAEAEDAR